MKLGEWQSALRTAQKGTVMSFLLYLCGNYDIKSSGTCWRYFTLLHLQQYTRRRVGQYWEINDTNEVLKVFHFPRSFERISPLIPLSSSTRATT
ncbi:hypothetical protein EDB85DRAFT_1927855 [Lactarius pseudohatsudake]|nr:hypothetical protein EDB85DRAFT_1927855 [Lactarius pseudohatsudake]